MIILEGQHKVLGKGIFVTDIQKGSLAFKVSSNTDLVLYTLFLYKSIFETLYPL